MTATAISITKYKKCYFTTAAFTSLGNMRTMGSRKERNDCNRRSDSECARGVLARGSEEGMLQSSLGFGGFVELLIQSPS